MSRRLHRFITLLAVLILLGGYLTPAVLALGGIDNFQDGTTQNWRDGQVGTGPDVVNVPDGGPLGPGTGDQFAQYASVGGVGPGSRLVMLNRSQWAGNYMAANVGQVGLQMANFGASALSIRIGVTDGTNRFVSTTPFNLPADSVWRAALFQINDASMTQVSGTDPLTTVLANVTELRVLSANGVQWEGDALAGTLGIDNVTPQTPTAVTLSSFATSTHPSQVASLFALMLSLTAFTIWWQRRREQAVILLRSHQGRERLH